MHDLRVIWAAVGLAALVGAARADDFSMATDTPSVQDTSGASGSAALGAGGVGAPAGTSVTQLQNPGTPASAAAISQPAAAQARQQLIAGNVSPEPVRWIRMEQSARALSDQEAKEHLAHAREAYMLKNYSQAASEIRRANAQLELQQAALNSARQDLETLANQAAGGQLKSGDDIEKGYQKAMNYQSRVQSEWPTTPTLAAAFRDEPRYHLDEARALFAKKDYNGSSQEIQRATAYLNLAADTASGTRKTALQDAVSRLTAVARDVKSGSADSMTRLDQAIQGAERAMNP